MKPAEDRLMTKDGHMIEPIHLRVFAVVVLLLVAAIVVVVWRGRKEQAEAFAGIKSPMMTLELPAEPADIKNTVGELGDKRRALMLRELTPDGLLFIPSYTFLFLGMSWLLTQRRLSWAMWVGILAGLCAIGTAALDYAENAHIRALLKTGPAETTQQMVDTARYVSMGKWGLSFVLAGLLSALFLWRRDVFVVFGVLYVLAALVGLVGLIYRPALGLGFLLLGATGLLVALAFIICPEKFLEGL